VREVETPRGVAPKKTYAYSLPEIQTILAALPNEPTHTLVLAAALTGLRRSELAGLKWEDVDFERKTISVRRAIWNGIASETKTEESEAEIPMVPLLAEALAEHKARNGFKSWCFHGETGNPLVIANVTRREIEPALEKAGIAWEGWHAFRRGVATNLHALGVPDKEIQSILRHSDVSITQKAYIKPDEKTKQGAMQQLQDAFRAAEVRP
jgi:integrase